MIVKYKFLKEKIAKKYLKQLISAVEYLHNNGIIHWDIKSSNILIDSKGIVKLIDFGSAKKIQ